MKQPVKSQECLAWSAKSIIKQRGLAVINGLAWPEAEPGSIRSSSTVAAAVFWLKLLQTYWVEDRKNLEENQDQIEILDKRK